jgi:protein-S-isoprenylcysteine O-methyltransferase Ste14
MVSEAYPCESEGPTTTTSSHRKPDYESNIVKTLASANHPAQTTWLAHLRGVRGFHPAVRILGCCWFLVLALIGATKLLAVVNTMSITDFGPGGWPALLSSLCLLLFYLALSWLTLHRPEPAAQTTGIMPSLTAFAGTYLPWTLMLFAPPSTSPAQDIAAASLLLVSTISMVAVITTLGRCFSIVPQARHLIRTGPYALVRHPLYLVEELALLGMLIQFFSLPTLLLFTAHAVLQVRRIYYEEDLLRRAFPEYGNYEASTRRLIPFVW